MHKNLQGSGVEIHLEPVKSVLDERVICSSANEEKDEHHAETLRGHKHLVTPMVRLDTAKVYVSGHMQH